VGVGNGSAPCDDYLKWPRRVGRGTRLTRQNRSPDLASVSMPCGLIPPCRGLWSPRRPKHAAADCCPTPRQAPCSPHGGG